MTDGLTHARLLACLAQGACFRGRYEIIFHPRSFQGIKHRVPGTRGANPAGIEQLLSKYLVPGIMWSATIILVVPAKGIGRRGDSRQVPECLAQEFTSTCKL